MGIVHHSNHVVWLEAARVEWLRGRGLSYRDLEDSGVSLAVSGLTITYRQPARFDDLVTVTARMTSLRSRRCKFSYGVHAEDGSLLATAETVHVPVDSSGRGLRLPDAWLERLAAEVQDTAG